jgi:hypothetical protein
MDSLVAAVSPEGGGARRGAVAVAAFDPGPRQSVSPGVDSAVPWAQLSPPLAAAGD